MKKITCAAFLMSLVTSTAVMAQTYNLFADFPSGISRMQKIVVDCQESAQAGARCDPGPLEAYVGTPGNNFTDGSLNQILNGDYGVDLSYAFQQLGTEYAGALAAANAIISAQNSPSQSRDKRSALSSTPMHKPGIQQKVPAVRKESTNPQNSPSQLQDKRNKPPSTPMRKPAVQQKVPTVHKEVLQEKRMEKK
jgi:hypothetical protein